MKSPLFRIAMRIKKQINKIISTSRGFSPPSKIQGGMRHLQPSPPPTLVPLIHCKSTILVCYETGARSCITVNISSEVHTRLSVVL